MTRINNIVMSGFKSFATKTELVLGEKFNCVLGPNGSGKSNVMDALSFVLGKGSAKGMRAEKAANLIYNGGKAKPPSKQGEVSIYFDNNDKTFPTDEKEVKITRIVKQTGQSVYKINDKVRTKQQILDLLSIARINPDGYNIILQGDIVKFVEMPPDERRKIIEEISGISIYEEKKKKAENELNRVEQKLNEADIILIERKGHLDELKTERDQALKYKDLRTKLTRSKATLLNTQILEKESQIKKVNENMEGYGNKVSKLQKEIDELNKKIKNLKEEERKINDDIENQGEKEQVTIHKEVEQLKVDVSTNKTRIGSCENEITRLTQRKDQLNKNLEDINTKIRNSEKEKEELSKAVKDKKQQLKQIEDKIKQYRSDNQLDNAGDIEKNIDSLDKDIDKKQIDIHKLREQQQEFMRNKDRIEFQIQSIDDKIIKVKELEKEYKHEIDQLKKDREELKTTTLKLSKSLDENQSITAQSTTARTKLEKIRENLAAINAKTNAARQVAAGDIATQKILENKSKFGKVYGTVYDLGSVKSKYSQALETAAGPRIKSIVVEDDKVAADCIKYLKQNKLGTATFLPLNKIKFSTQSEELKKLMKANGVHGLASDLITYDPKFNKIFSYVFGRTLIVDSIDTARRIGVGTVRMSSLTGDLVETSGAMHGGFRKKTTFSFKEDELMAETKELEKQEADYQKLLTNVENNRKNNEDEITELREKKANLEGEIIKKEKSLHLDSDDVKASVQVKEDFIKELTQIDKELTEMQNKISLINQDLAKIKTEKQKLRDQIGELRNPRKLAELNAFEQKKDELKEDIMKFEGEAKNIDIQIKTILEPEKYNTLKILKQHDKEEADFNEEIRLLKDTIKKQNEELKIKEVKENEFRKQFKGLFGKRNEISDNIRKFEEKEIVKDKQLREIEIKSNSYSVETARFKAELAALEEEYKQYEKTELLANKNKDNLRENIRRYDIALASIGNVNMKALEIYDIVEKEYNNLNEKKDMLRLEKEDVIMMMNEIESKKKDLFIKAFEIANQNFKSIFQQLSTKGDAYLEIENSEDPLAEGVLIKVRITGKKFLDIRSLSGGEKTLTALAFIFSIQEHDPASFYILDEVDAALDKRNAEKLAALIKKYAERAQYLIISHNDGVIAEADTLYGVSMNEHGMSKIVSLKV